MHPVHMLVEWSKLIGRPLELNFDHDDDGNAGCLYIASWFDPAELYDVELLGCALFGSGLEVWDDPKLAARFVFDLLAQHLNPRVNFVDIGDHRRWSRDWQDREKARAFLNAARELNVYEDTGFDVAPPTA